MILLNCCAVCEADFFFMVPSAGVLLNPPKKDKLFLENVPAPTGTDPSVEI
jgi:hypothetical protein